MSPLTTDQSEETDALVNLVESGADLLKTVSCLLRDMQTLSVVESKYLNAISVTVSEVFCTTANISYLARFFGVSGRCLEYTVVLSGFESQAPRL